MYQYFVVFLYYPNIKKYKMYRMVYLTLWPLSPGRPGSPSNPRSPCKITIIIIINHHHHHHHHHQIPSLFLYCNLSVKYSFISRNSILKYKNFRGELRYEIWKYKCMRWAPDLGPRFSWHSSSSISTRTTLIIPRTWLSKRDSK